MIYRFNARPGPTGSLFRSGVSLNMDKIKKLDWHTRISEVEQILVRAMTSVAELAEFYVPVATGKLKGTIQVEVAESNRVRIVVTVTAGNNTDVYYAPYVEFGGANPPQPFLRPAWDSLKDDVKKQITEGVAQLIARHR